MRSERPDHYAILGVSTTATPRQITHAYRALVRALHPDTATAPGDTRSRFTAVTTAYQVLHDPTRRAAYDQTRHTTSPSPTATPPSAQAPITIHVAVPVAPPADVTPAQRDTHEPMLRAGPTRFSPLPYRRT